MRAARGVVTNGETFREIARCSGSKSESESAETKCAGATVVPQSSVSAKWAPIAVPLMVSAAEPILRKTVVCAELVLPML